MASQTWSSYLTESLFRDILLIWFIDVMVVSTTPVQRDLCIHGIIKPVFFMEYIVSNHIANNFRENIVTVHETFLKLKNLGYHRIAPAFVTRVLSIHSMLNSCNRISLEMPNINILRNIPDFICTTLNHAVEGRIFIGKKSSKANIISLQERSSIQLAKHN